MPRATRWIKASQVREVNPKLISEPTQEINTTIRSEDVKH